MAESFEGRLSITGADEVERELARIEKRMRKLERAQGDTSESSDELADSTDNTSNSLGGLDARAVAAAAAVAGVALAIKEAVSITKELAAEFERQAGVLTRFEGSVDEASRRVNGLVSDLDLMIASNSAVRGGLDLSEQQFADLSVAATEMAAATGEDATEALNDLIDALKGGSPDELMEKFGVELGEVTDKSKVQRMALDQLSDKYGDMESSADTAGGKLTEMQTAMENARLEMVETINKTSVLEESLDDMGESLSRASEAFVGGNEALSGFERAGLLATAVASGMGQQVSALADAFSELASGNITAAAEELQGFGDIALANQIDEALDKAVDQAVGAEGKSLSDRINDRAMAEAKAQQQGLGEGFQVGLEGVEIPGAGENDNGGGGGGGRSRQRGPAVDAAEVDLEQLAWRLESENAIADARERQLDSLAIANRWHERNLKTIEKEKAAANAYKAELNAAAAKSQALAQEFRSMAQEQRKKQEQEAQEQQKIMEVGLQAGLDVVEGLGKAIASSQEDALQEWLKAQAKRWGFKALEETALGIATLFMNQAESSTHFIAAGMFGGLAAAAGAGSAAAGGGASKGGAQSQAGASPESSPGGGRDRGGGTTIVNVNSPVPEVELGRTTARAMRAAGRVRAA